MLTCVNRLHLFAAEAQETLQIAEVFDLSQQRKALLQSARVTAHVTCRHLRGNRVRSVCLYLRSSHMHFTQTPKRRLVHAYVTLEACVTEAALCRAKLLLVIVGHHYSLGDGVAEGAGLTVFAPILLQLIMKEDLAA